MLASNAQLSELLARAADGHPRGTNKRKALQRAARHALFFWPEEAASVTEAGRPLTELSAVGPWVSSVIEGWFGGEDIPPEVDEVLGQEPPEVRRGFLCMADVQSILSGAPEWRRELRGDLQMHTTHSDGQASALEMAEACLELGHEFVNITDHSKGLPIAGGMDEGELAEEGLEIAALNRDLEASGRPLRVLHGIEMNLSPEGEGDMDPAALARLDLVLGAFHSKLRLTEDQTGRYLAALANPDIHVLAHPRGRRWGARAGLHADWDVVMAAAVERGRAMEIDAYPDRQDLQVELLEVAREAGTIVSIGTDAHSTWELGFMQFGLAAAARAGIPRERILNYWPVEQVLAWARPGR